MASDEAHMGSKLVHYWGPSQGPILSEAHHIVYTKDPLHKRCDPKELVS